MSTYLRECSLQVLLLSGSLFYACSAWSDPFAPEGAQGVLEIDVTVDGAGSEQAAPGAGWKSRRWSVKHSGMYRLAMVAKDAVIDGEQSGSAADDIDDADWEAYWEKKTEACGGDPVCEMDVATQQMSDPHAQTQMEQLGDLTSAAQQAGPGDVPNAQTWRIASRSGSVRIEQHDDRFGVISETGGLVDVLCTSTTDQALDPKPPLTIGAMSAEITIDGSSSRYTLQLPIEESFMLKRLCTNGGEPFEDPLHRATLLLGDRTTEGSSWSSTLHIQGNYLGGPSAPVFEGKKEIQAGVLGAQNRKATVTIVWRFHPS